MEKMQLSENYIYDLSKLSVILVSGDDASIFLQGQITNDITLVTETKSIYAGFCNPKGRLLAFFHIVKYYNNYLLFCPKSIAESITKRLSMYILRAKVKIELNPDDVMYFGICNNNTGNQLDAGIENPKYPMDVINNQSLTIIRLSSVGLRLMFVGGKNECSNLIETRFSCAIKDEESGWNVHDINSGIPNIFLETQELFIPQSINLDLIEAINFKKGCYTGQEIVARTHYLGKPKRRMYIATIESKNPPNYSNVITEGDESVGHIVDFSDIGNNNFRLLIETRIESISLELMVNGTKILLSDSEVVKFKLN